MKQCLKNGVQEKTIKFNKEVVIPALTEQVDKPTIPYCE